jgi:hypothetical protein
MQHGLSYCDFSAWMAPGDSFFSALVHEPFKPYSIYSYTLIKMVDLQIYPPKGIDDLLTRSYVRGDFNSAARNSPHNC